MKVTCKFVKKACDRLLEQEEPIECSVNKPVCIYQYELLNLITNLQRSERSSENLRFKLAEIDKEV